MTMTSVATAPDLAAAAAASSTAPTSSAGASAPFAAALADAQSGLAALPETGSGVATSAAAPTTPAPAAAPAPALATPVAPTTAVPVVPVLPGLAAAALGTAATGGPMKDDDHATADKDEMTDAAQDASGTLASVTPDPSALAAPPMAAALTLPVPVLPVPQAAEQPSGAATGTPGTDERARAAVTAVTTVSADTISAAGTPTVASATADAASSAPNSGSSPVSAVQPAAVPTAAPVSAPVAQAAPAAAPTAAPTAALGHHVVAQLKPPVLALRAAGDGQHIVTVKVTPDAFGTVTITAHVSGQSVHIEMLAPTDQSREALKALLPDLRRDLAQPGTTTTLDLTARDPGSQAQQGRGDGPASDRGASREHRPASEQLTASTTRSSASAASGLDILV